MLPRINGKEIIDCDLTDLQVIIDNPSFAENEYLDYKKSFTIDEVPKEQKLQEQIELRNDVCSFANAEGGYLLFGIKEIKGVPTKIEGITIKGNSRDLFERELKNYLQPIKPRIPFYQIRFLELPDNRYVVVLLVKHDYFAPYAQLVDEKNYHFYKRIGNAKRYIEYQELRTMFTQSISLEKEIEKFRQERIDSFLSQEDNEQHTYSQFLLLHIIPDTFLEKNYDKPMFALQQKGLIKSYPFDAFQCNSRPYPMAEGLRFVGRHDNSECKLYDNGIAEYFCGLRENMLLCSQNNTDAIIVGSLWDRLINSVVGYIKVLNKVVEAKRLFVGISIIGCKGAITGENSLFEIVSTIDRNRLECFPVVFEKLENGSVDDFELSRLQLTYLTSLGIVSDPFLDALLDKVYGVDDSKQQSKG